MSTYTILPKDDSNLAVTVTSDDQSQVIVVDSATQQVTVTEDVISVSVTPGLIGSLTVDSVNGKTGLVVLGTGDINESGSPTNKYYTASRDTAQFNIDLALKTTDDLTEGSTNEYYTDARARAAIQGAGDINYSQTTGIISFDSSSLVTSVNGQDGQVILSTSNIAEGSNKYWTQVRFNDALAASDTDDLDEGDVNLYYTNVRVQSVIDTNSEAFIKADTTNTLTNKSGSNSQWTNDEDYIKADTSDVLTNKTGAISQWTNDSDYVKTINGIEGPDVELDTDMIDEDASPANKWFTEARARASMSVTQPSGDGTLTYDDSTGVFTYTGPSESDVRTLIDAVDAGGDGSFSYDNSTGRFTYTGPSATEVRDHFTGGTGVTFNDTNGDISIGQPVATTDDVTFNTVTGNLTGNVTGNVTGDLTGPSAGVHTGNVTGDLTGDVTGTVSDISNHSTTDLTEGTNLYYTDTRSRDAIETTQPGGDGTISYNSATGVITYTGPSETEVRNHITKAFVDALGIQASSVDADSVALGTDTTGDYVKTIEGTANKIEVSGSGTEGRPVTLTLPSTVQIATDLTVGGNLTVNGDLTYLNTTDLQIQDNLFELNAGLTGTPTNDSGMLIQRGNQTNQIFMWDESVDKFALGATTSEDGAIGNITVTIGTLKANIEGDVTGDVTGDVDGVLGGTTPAAASVTTLTASGTITGDVIGDLTGNSAGTHTGAVIGDVTGDVTGDLIGDSDGTHTGNVTGDVTGDLTGNVTSTGTSTFTTADINGGNIDGTIIGAVTTAAGSFTTVNASGAITGDLTGNSAGQHTGSVVGTTVSASTGFTGDLTGDVTGSFSGDITGDVEGDLTGNVIGNVTGDVIGSLDGNVVGNVTGDLIGDSDGTHTGPVDGTTVTASSGFAGALVGNVTGNVIGNVTGDVAGDVTGKITATGTGAEKSVFTEVDINGGTIDGTPIGGNVASTGEFTTVSTTLGITANTGFTGDLTGDVTGDTAGVHTGNVIGDVTGDVTGTVSGNAGTVSSLSNQSTTNLQEGNNLYYTTARTNTDFDTRLATKDTDDLAEGSNQYYTDAKVDTRISNTSIDGLSDVDTSTTAPVTAQVLEWDGNNWIPGDSGIGDVTQTGQQTLTNKTLTSPILTSPKIDVIDLDNSDIELKTSASAVVVDFRSTVATDNAGTTRLYTNKNRYTNGTTANPYINQYWSKIASQLTLAANGDGYDFLSARAGLKGGTTTPAEGDDYVSILELTGPGATGTTYFNQSDIWQMNRIKSMSDATTLGRLDVDAEAISFYDNKYAFPNTTGATGQSLVMGTSVNGLKQLVWSSSSGAVASVNGHIGQVVLDTNDIEEPTSGAIDNKWFTDDRVDDRLNDVDLDEIGDVVYESAPSDGDVLLWDAGIGQTGAWRPNLVTGSGTVTSVTAGSHLEVAAGGSSIVAAGTLNVLTGSTANDIVALDGSGRLPAVNGSQLLDLPDSGVQTVTAGNGLLVSGSANPNITDTGTLEITANVATNTNTITFTNKSGSNSMWTNDENYLDTSSSISNLADVSYATTPTDGQVLEWNNTSSNWEPGNASGGGTGTVTSVDSGTGLTGGPITASGTLNVDVGTTANKIVQLDGSAKLPAVDGSLLTGLPSGYDDADVDTHLNTSTALSSEVLSWTGSDYAWTTAGAGDVTLTGTQTLTNKTLTSPIIGDFTGLYTSGWSGAQWDFNTDYTGWTYGSTGPAENWNTTVKTGTWQDPGTDAINVYQISTANNKNIVRFDTHNDATAVTSSGDFVIGNKYVITALGDTTQAQWETAGVSDTLTAAVATVFTGAAFPAGTGTIDTWDTGAQFVTMNIKGADDIGFVDAGSFVTSRVYKIFTLGTTDWNTVAGTSGETYAVDDLITAAAAGSGDGRAVDMRPYEGTWNRFGSHTSSQPAPGWSTNLEFKANKLRFKGRTGSGYVFPLEDGTANQQLTTDGNGQLTWAAPATGGTVTSVTASTGLTGGTITGTGTLSIDSTVLTTSTDADALADINYTTTPADKQVLEWNNANQYWEPGTNRALTIQDEGSDLTGVARILDFQGTGVSSANDPSDDGIKIITISGGGGGSSDLDGLTDVDITSVANNDLLMYNSTASKWQNTNLGVSVTPTLTGDSSADAGQSYTLTVSNHATYDDPAYFVEVYTSTTKVVDNDDVTDNLDGTLTFTAPAAGTHEIRIRCQDFGDLQSEIATKALTTTAFEFNYRYFRILFDSAISTGTLIPEFALYTAASQGGTKWPTSAMTSNTLPTPFVASAQGTYSAYAPWKAFDNSTGQWWNLSGTANTDYLAIDLGSAQTIKSFKVRTAGFVQSTCKIQASSTNAWGGEEVDVSSISLATNSTFNIG